MESDSGSYHGPDSGESVTQVVGEEIVSDKHDLLSKLDKILQLRERVLMLWRRISASGHES